VTSAQRSSARLHVLRDYAAGRIGTREAIRRAGLDDYADLIIALAQHDLDLPKPADTPQRKAHLERAAAILQPLLRRKGFSSFPCKK
jgi:hypothetical protein